MEEKKKLKDRTKGKKSEREIKEKHKRTLERKRN